MTPPNLNSARLIRDGGIEAMAALNAALQSAIVGLSPSDQENITLTFGRVMGEIVTEIINPAISAFPELQPDQSTWASVANGRLEQRRRHDEPQVGHPV